MITGFEDITYELTEIEQQVLLPIIIRGLLLKNGKENAVTNKSIVAGMEKLGYKVTDIRVRKIINYIRVKNLIPGLLASSKGYYISTDRDEVLKYIQSLRERNSQVERVIEVMQQYLNTLKQ